MRSAGILLDEFSVDGGFAIDPDSRCDVVNAPVSRLEPPLSVVWS